MSSINFYLDKADRKNLSPILLAFVTNRQRFRYYTKMKVPKSAWDFKNQKVKKEQAGSAEINSLLESYKETIKQIERESLFRREALTTDQIKDRFEVAIGRQKSPEDFHLVYERYLEISKPTKTPNTMKGLKSSYAKLKNFEKSRKYQLTFESINKNFYDLYIDYLINECKHLNNTVGKFIKNLKFFMNYATDSCINKNLQFRKFKVMEEEVDLIFLTNDELMRLFSMPIENETLYKVRENFCFECFTGLRFSDVSKLEHTNFDNDMVKLKAQKTKRGLTIPLNKYALAIIERNKGKYRGRPLPACFSLAKTNMYLKDLGKLAELNNWVHIVKYSGAKRVELNKQKFDFLTTHAARRTFITLSLERRMRPEVVMQITGIKKWETFKRYIKITDTAKIIEMNAKWNDSYNLKAI